MVVAIVLAFGFTKPSVDNKKLLENLSGTYVDPVPYNYGKAWGKREFSFDKGN